MTSIRLGNKPRDMEFEELLAAQLDITGPCTVESSVSADGQVMWVNVNGVCVLRVCKAQPSLRRFRIEASPANDEEYIVYDDQNDCMAVCPTAMAAMRVANALNLTEAS